MKKIYRGSLIHELVCKSREAALSSIQIFNNPLVMFKSETFIVLMNIAWTYMLHAYYKTEDVDFRYVSVVNGKKRYGRTKNGAFKTWELRRCLDDKNSPIDKESANNLRFLIGIRDEIEHQMTQRIDDLLSAKFQACCLNFNRYIKKFFGDEFGLDRYLAFSLQFTSINEEQKAILSEAKELPQNISTFIANFESQLSQEEIDNPNYAYRLIFIPKIANHKGQADKVIEFIKADSPLADTVNKEYVAIRETEKPKYLPSQIVKMMKDKGYDFFTITMHAMLWKERDAKNPDFKYGVMVAGKHWHWYGNWVDVVEEYCKHIQQQKTNSK